MSLAAVRAAAATRRSSMGQPCACSLGRPPSTAAGCFVGAPVLSQRGHSPRPPARQRLARGPRRRSWPLRAVLENGWFAGKRPQRPGVRALWGQQWARLPFCVNVRKYCPNGGMGFARDQLAASAAPGVREGDHGPFRRLLKTGGFAGETARVSGVRALWEQQWTRLPFFTHTTKYCHNGA